MMNQEANRLSRLKVQPLILVTVMGLAGCLEREEDITVQKDGSLSIVHRIHGDKGDLEKGAARLPSATAFRTERSTFVNQQGNTEELLTAWADFPTAADVPRHFGNPAGRLKTAALTMGTKVSIRREGKRTYYKFERRYDPRRWAAYAVFRRRAFPDDVRELLSDKDLWRRPVEDQRRALGALVYHERMKLQYWAELALGRVAAVHERLLETQLAVRAAITRRFTDELDTDALLLVLAKSPAEIERWSEGIYVGIDELTRLRAAEDLGLGDAKLRELDDALAEMRHEFDVTQDLEDEAFKVRLKLPGRITAHNADKADAGMLVWHFHGQDLRDRPQVLVAISVLEE